MKQNIIFMVLLISFCLPALAQKGGKTTVANKGFVITGTIPGTTDGCEVCLWLKEYGNDALATTKIKNHSFRLTGHVSKPTLCQFYICDVKDPNSQYVLPPERGILLFIENVAMKISAAHFTDLPLIHERENPLLKEFNVKVETKGFAQNTFMTYRHYIHEVDLKSGNAFKDYLAYQERKTINRDTLLMKRADMLSARALYNAAVDRFVRQHPDYPISLMEIRDKAEDTFVYTDKEYDDWLQLFKVNKDKVRYEAFAKSIAAARTCPKGRAYTDFGVVTPDSLQGRFSQYLNKKGYTLVDFWASWCGWCRRAIPHIKEMYAKYDRSKLTIVSVSTDDSKSAWYRAMKLEDMPWQQLLLAKDSKELVDKAYNMLGIPDFLIVDAQGRVVYATSSPDELDVELSKILK